MSPLRPLAPRPPLPAFVFRCIPGNQRRFADAPGDPRFRRFVFRAIPVNERRFEGRAAAGEQRRRGASHAGDRSGRALHRPARLWRRGRKGRDPGGGRVSLDVSPGETLGLVGESGSGKTTLGRAMLRLVAPTAGRVEFEGLDITHLAEKDLRPLRRRMQPVFQDPHAALNPAMTIGDAVAHPLLIQGLAAGRDEARAGAAAMLERVGITPGGDVPRPLPGGPLRRPEAAGGHRRALVTGPSLVVADEPVAMLDMSVRALVLALLADLRREFGLTYVFITHDLATAHLLCDRVAVMYQGQLVEVGPAAEVLAHPRHAYTQALLAAVPRIHPAAT